MISIVTGTLNRVSYLQTLIDNTVNNDDRIELVLVDGGSTDGTIDFLKGINHPRIKLIEVGHRSYYPHFMNLGIRNASHEYICQWNDDIYLINNWSEVISYLGNEDVYAFTWNFGDLTNRPTNYIHLCRPPAPCVNYGIYKKDVFRKIGMYNNEYKYYWADSDMSTRARFFGMQFKICETIQAISIKKELRAIEFPDDENIFRKNIMLYAKGILPPNIEYL